MLQQADRASMNLWIVIWCTAAWTDNWTSTCPRKHLGFISHSLQEKPVGKLFMVATFLWFPCYELMAVAYVELNCWMSFLPTCLVGCAWRVINSKAKTTCSLNLTAIKSDSILKCNFFCFNIKINVSKRYHTALLEFFNLEMFQNIKNVQKNRKMTEDEMVENTREWK